MVKMPQKYLLGMIAVLLCSVIMNVFAKTAYRKMPGSPQCLKTVVRDTLKNNPDSLRAKENIKVAEQALARARGDFLPLISFRYATGQEKTDSYSKFESGAESEIDNNLNRREASLVMSESVFSGFSTYNLVKERKQELKTRRYGAMSVREVLSLQAAAAYLEVLRAKAIYALVLNNIVVHRETLQKVSVKFRTGAGRKTEMDLARGRLSQANSNLFIGRRAIKDAIAAFLKVVGYRPRRLKKVIKLPKTPRSLGQAKEIALTRNPVLKVSKSQFLAADKALRVAKSLRYPRVNIEVSRSTNYNLDGTEGRSRDWQGMLVFNYIVFNGGKDEASIKQAAHQRMSELYQQNTTKREVMEDVDNAWNDLQADRNRLSELKAHVVSSRAVLYGYKKQFELGRRSLLDVLNTEDELFRARASYVNGVYAIKSDTYRLLAAMGVLAAYFKMA